MPKTGTLIAPIIEHEYVKQFLEIFKANQSPSANGLLSVLGQVTAMEKQLEAVVQELAAMRRDLVEMEQRNHPIKTVLQKSVIVMF